MQQSGKCIFCGGGGLTKEHVFAQWLHPYLPIDDRPNHESFFEHILPGGPQTEIRTRSGDPHSGKLRVVCRSCNNGWMSRLQTQTKPILLPLVSGERTILWKRQAQTLASWATMFVMVTEWARRNSELVVSTSSDRLGFSQTTIPPRGWKIWVGRYERGDWPGVFARTTFPIESPETPVVYASNGAAMPNSQAVTFVIGQVAFHVFCSPIRAFVQKQQLPAEAISQLWPLRKTPVRWPLDYTLSDIDMDNLANRVNERMKSVLGLPFTRT